MVGLKPGQKSPSHLQYFKSLYNQQSTRTLWQLVPKLANFRLSFLVGNCVFCGVEGIHVSIPHTPISRGGDNRRCPGGLPTYLLTVFACLLTYIHTYLHTYLPSSFLPTYFVIFLHTVYVYLHTYLLPIYLLYLAIFLLRYLLIYKYLPILTYLLKSLFEYTCLPTYTFQLSSYLPTYPLP